MTGRERILTRVSLDLMREMEEPFLKCSELSSFAQNDAYVVLQGDGGIDAARSAFARFANERVPNQKWGEHRLLWRTLPELTVCDDGSQTFYMRMQII